MTQPLGELSLNLFRLFARSDSAGGANISTSAAVYTNFGVDGVLFAFGNSAGGTLVDAGAACDAVITNYVSHCL